MSDMEITHKCDKCGREYVWVGESNRENPTCKYPPKRGEPICGGRLIEVPEKPVLNPENYRTDPFQKCQKCSRLRVQVDGVCEKCVWDNDGGDWAFITRPDQYSIHGRRHDLLENKIL